jgi:hypothetical protein
VLGCNPDVRAGSEVFLRPTAELSFAITASSPIVSSYVSPLQDAMVARQASRESHSQFVIANAGTSQRINELAGGSQDRIPGEALVGLGFSVEVAEIEVEVAEMVGCDFHSDIND